MIVRVAGLTALWVALWGDVSAGNVVWGALIGVVLVLLFPAGPRSGGRGARLRPMGTARLVGHVFVNLVVSSWAVVRAVLSPTPERTRTTVLTVPLATRSPLVASVVANSITLTPGTMTLCCDPDTFELTVHVLGAVDPDEFAGRIGELERIAAGAIFERDRQWGAR